MRPLAKQVVAPTDSVLGSLSRYPNPGLAIASYDALIQGAFQRQWWQSPQVIQVKIDGTFDKFVTNGQLPLADNQFTLMEYNFSLFAGLSIQKYISTLISDQTPFDKYQAGDTSALTPQEQVGLNIYVNLAAPAKQANAGGNCNTCHTLPEGTRASVRRAFGVHSTDFSDPLINNNAFGFINNYGIRPAVDDPGGEAINPLENSKFKIPNLRNIALTAPYFHNGGNLTLEQVVDFYARGRGDAGVAAAATLPALLDTTPATDVTGQPTTVGQNNKAALIAFLRNGLTDQRVLYEQAPFDHPQIFVPNGHPYAAPGNTTPIARGNTNYPIAIDQLLEIKAVGAAGVTTPQSNFLGLP
jgi:hypothetical protein